MSEAKNLMSKMGLKLYYGDKLKLNEKSREELCKMRDGLKNSFYRRACSFLHIPLSSIYTAKLEIIEFGIEYTDMIEQRKNLGISL